MTAECKYEINFENHYSQSWTNDVAEPLDFEEFLNGYQNLIDRDPLRTILDIPQGDVEVEVIERPIRTLKPIVPEEKMYVCKFIKTQGIRIYIFSFSESLPPHVQACVECYKSFWRVVRYTHRSLSSSVSSRSNLAKAVPSSPKQEFEVDFQGVPSSASSELGQ